MSLDIKTNVLMPHNQTSFKGSYILKGVARDVIKAESLIYRNCADSTNIMLHPGRKFAMGFDSFNSALMTNVFDEAQPNVELLIGTNEHSKKIVKWNNKISHAKDMEASIDSYRKAKIALEKGDTEPMKAILNNISAKTKQRINVIKEAIANSVEEIKELDAAEVIRAIKEKRFNYITGEIKNI